MLVPIATRLAWPLPPPPLAQRRWDGYHLGKGRLNPREGTAPARHHAPSRARGPGGLMVHSGVSCPEHLGLRPLSQVTASVLANSLSWVIHHGPC